MSLPREVQAAEEGVEVGAEAQDYPPPANGLGSPA